MVLGGSTALLPLAACAARLDRFTVDRVVVAANEVPDTGKVCALGASLAFPLDSLSKTSPHRAMTITEGVAGVCDQQEAWEAELEAARVRKNGVALGEARAAEITDASLRAARAHGRAAARFERSFEALEAEWGPVGAECPRIAERDEFVYLFGLLTGTLALLHDRASGGMNDIPLDRPLNVARGAACLDNAAWWSAPDALRGAAWATIPGSAPEGVDPWQLLAEAAASGDQSGVRVSRAMYVLIAANAGQSDRLAEALTGLGETLAATPPDPQWALLDRYAVEVAQHQSDLLWTAARGHRTERLGELPSATAAVAPAGPDPFAASDPFTDPFGSPEPPRDPQEETP